MLTEDLTTLEDTGDRLLDRAAVLFAIAVILHNGDHLRRGTDNLTAQVFWVGTLAIVVEVALVVLISQRHRLAPVAAAAGGLTLAAGYVEVHVLPANRWLSDSFTSASDVSPVSWAAAGLEITAAIVLAVAGLMVLRRRGGLASIHRAHPTHQALGEALLHPVALVMVLSQAATVVLSFAQAYA